MRSHDEKRQRALNRVLSLSRKARSNPESGRLKQSLKNAQKRLQLLDNHPSQGGISSK